jgi:glycosyltransferase involved in cell wall biosynthesis
MLDSLLKSLNAQLQFLRPLNNVEILTCIDNKQRTTGAKRQELLQRAKGEYVVYIDDDDEVMSHYIFEMVKACKKGMDCVAIKGHMTTDGGQWIEWRLSKDYDNVTIVENGKQVYLRRTNHITAVKKSIALFAGFMNLSNGEDKYYSERLDLKTEAKIDLPMYHYRFTTQNKEY